MSNVTELTEANLIVREEIAGWGISAEVYKKPWPADEMTFIKLSLDSYDEYVLIAPGSSEESVRKSLNAAIRRLWRWKENGI